MKIKLKSGLVRILATCAIGLVAGQASAQDVTANLPDNLKALYVGVGAKLMPSAYDNFKAKPLPWKWCYSESYQGSPWRVSVTNELRRLVEQTGSTFEISNSNLDAALQINHIRAFIDKGCTVITAIPGSATALNDAIQAAYDAGIPFVGTNGAVTSPYAINVDNNYMQWGYDLMKATAKKKGGKANILVVEGLAGNPTVAQERDGIQLALKEEPGLKVIRYVNGNWTENVTKTVVFQTLATFPGAIDAVWSTGSQGRVIAQAFAEAGRPAPLITGTVSGDMIGYWKANPGKLEFTGHGFFPSWTASTLYRVAARMLSGQHPKLNTLIMPIPVVDQADFEGMYEKCMTPDAVSVFPVPKKDPAPESMLDGYFTNPAPSPHYDYSTVGHAC